MPAAAPKPTLRRYATAASAAEYAQVTPRTIRNWIQRGMLTAYRAGTRIVRVDLNEIDALLSPVGGTE